MLENSYIKSSIQIQEKNAWVAVHFKDRIIELLRLHVGYNLL